VKVAQRVGLQLGVLIVWKTMVATANGGING
jgi:hypothetical protein